MARYFFHLEADSHLIEDLEGSELESAEEARRVAIKSLRRYLPLPSNRVRTDLRYAILIADESGQELVFLPLAEVLPKWFSSASEPSTVLMMGTPAYQTLEMMVE